MSRANCARALILVYAVLSGALYCALLPLWEGFDELYHYGYVQYLLRTRTLPVIGKIRLSRELWTSLDFQPVSHFVQPYFYRPSITFEQYFRLSDKERRILRKQLDSIDVALQGEPSPRENYEAMQAPLTYLLLGPFERLFASLALPTRVLALRLLLSIASLVLLWIGSSRLAQRLALPAGMETAALFAIFSCQMLYAASCRVGNDALAAPWLLFFLSAVIDACEFPNLSRTILTAVMMALGLLIKASLLIFLPLCFVPPVLVLVRRTQRFSQALQRLVISLGILFAVAGPWYIRNVVLYHNVTATVESTSGVGPKQLLEAAASLPWRQSVAATVHMALWTGNNSYTTFSASTLNVFVALLGLAAVLYCSRARRSAPEMMVVSSILLYGIGLVGIMLSFFYSSHGSVITPMPWYVPVLIAPIALICFLGLARWQPWGRWIALAAVLLCAYVSAATWVAKLVPMYGGFSEPHARPRQLFAWYLNNSGQRDSILSSLCPGPLPLLYLLFAALLIMLIVCTVATCLTVGVRASLSASPLSGGRAKPAWRVPGV